jgi:glycosyltransferase involved in cell wall biosynthesis
VPAVASPIGDIPSQIIEGTTGYLAREPSDWFSLSKILLENSELRARMSEAAQRHAKETYSAQATADIALDVLTRVATRDQ